jgi:hypothetical protein
MFATRNKIKQHGICILFRGKEKQKAPNLLLLCRRSFVVSFSLCFIDFHQRYHRSLSDDESFLAPCCAIYIPKRMFYANTQSARQRHTQRHTVSDRDKKNGKWRENHEKS